MTEIGSIFPIKRIACPACGAFIEEVFTDKVTSEGAIKCSSCQSPVKLPDEVVRKIQARKHTGQNFDIVA